MIKNILFCIIILTTQLTYAQRSQNVDILCAFTAANHYKQIVKFKMFARDKYRHCTVSCIVGLECGITATAVIGMAKEIYDVFGPGNAEWGDLLANVIGLRISKRASVSNLKQCSTSCKTYYPVGNATQSSSVF